MGTKVRHKNYKDFTQVLLFLHKKSNYPHKKMTLEEIIAVEEETQVEETEVVAPEPTGKKRRARKAKKGKKKAKKAKKGKKKSKKARKSRKASKKSRKARKPRRARKAKKARRSLAQRVMSALRALKGKATFAAIRALK